MNTKERSPRVVVDFGDKSKLSRDLKSAIVSLNSHSNTQYRLHVCLNSRDGYEALQRLVRDQSLPIRAMLSPHLIMSGGNLWLNVEMYVNVADAGFDSGATLSPQQTGHIVRSLPEQSRNQFLDCVRAWYTNVFLKDIKAGLDRVTAQIKTGDLLLEDDHDNRVFDIHGGRCVADIPYTEADIVGATLFWSVVYGGTLFEHGSDGYDRADQLILGRYEHQQNTASSFLEAVRHLR